MIPGVDEYGNRPFDTNVPKDPLAAMPDLKGGFGSTLLSDHLNESAKIGTYGPGALFT